MIYNCFLKENNDSDVYILINDVELYCFSNQGITGVLGEQVMLELDLFDDIDIKQSESSIKK